MKTTTELNNKTWYRLLKVLYILSFVIDVCVILILAIAMDTNLTDMVGFFFSAFVGLIIFYYVFLLIFYYIVLGTTSPKK